MIFKALRYVSIGYLALSSGFAFAIAGNDSVVTNNMKETVRVYWTAAGCAKIVDGKTFVCESRLIAPGQSSTYEFRSFTSVNKVAVSGPKACDGQQAVDGISKVTVNPDCALGSEAVQFTNNRTETIKLYWTAIGCFRVEDGIPLVCRAVRLEPKGVDRYAFAKGHTTRGATWTSATCPTTLNQRALGSKSMQPEIHVTDKMKCEHIGGVN